VALAKENREVHGIAEDARTARTAASCTELYEAHKRWMAQRLNELGSPGRMLDISAQTMR